MLLGICSFRPYCPIYWHRVIHSIFIKYFTFVMSVVTLPDSFLTFLVIVYFSSFFPGKAWFYLFNNNLISLDNFESPSNLPFIRSFSYKDIGIFFLKFLSHPQVAAISTNVIGS